MEVGLRQLRIYKSERDQFARLFIDEIFRVEDLLLLREKHADFPAKIAWTLELIALARMELILPHLPYLFAQLDKGCSASEHRCLMHAVLILVRKKDDASIAACLKRLDCWEMQLYDDSAVAVKSYTLYLLYHLGYRDSKAHRIGLDYIEHHPLHEKAAVQMACKRFYNSLKKSPNRALAI